MRTWGERTLAAGLAAALALAPFGALADRGEDEARGQNPFRNIAVTGTTADGQQLRGRFDIERVQQIGEQLVAVGTLSGKLGNRSFNHQAIAVPLAVSQGDTQGGFGGTTGSLLPGLKTRPAAFHPGASQGLAVIPAQTCPVLHLTLGPLDLNLLGLVVHLNQVVLNIDAQGGPGNLLGNLLCAVTNLLNPPNLAGLTGLLNQIIGILNGL